MLICPFISYIDPVFCPSILCMFLICFLFMFLKCCVFSANFVYCSICSRDVSCMVLVRVLCVSCRFLYVFCTFSVCFLYVSLCLFICPIRFYTLSVFVFHHERALQHWGAKAFLHRASGLVTSRAPGKKNQVVLLCPSEWVGYLSTPDKKNGGSDFVGPKLWFKTINGPQGVS